MLLTDPDINMYYFKRKYENYVRLSSRKLTGMRFTLVFEARLNIMDPLKVECTPTYKLAVIIPKEGYFYVVLNSFLGRPQDFLFFLFL